MIFELNNAFGRSRDIGGAKSCTALVNGDLHGRHQSVSLLPLDARVRKECLFDFVRKRKEGCYQDHVVAVVRFLSVAGVNNSLIILLDHSRAPNQVLYDLGCIFHFHLVKLEKKIVCDRNQGTEEVSIFRRVSDDSKGHLEDEWFEKVCSLTLHYLVFFFVSRLGFEVEVEALSELSMKQALNLLLLFLHDVSSYHAGAILR